jgi:sRNA-binding protein
MKRSLFVVALGIGIGYILGARAGRERYDLIVEKVSGVWEDPRVAKARTEAARYAREQAPVILDQAQKAGKATAARAQDLADRAVTTAKSVAEKATTTATSAANTAAAKATDAAAKVAEIRDDALEDGTES